jgi:cell division septal protein FtsQ
MMMDREDPETEGVEEERIVVREKKGPARLGIWLFIPLAAAIIILCAFAQQWKDSLTVQAVVVAGHRLLSEQEVADLAGLNAGERLYDIDLYSVQQRILSQPVVRTASVVRQLPSSIRVEISEREPIAFITTNQMYAIDREGMLLPQHLANTQFDVPVINGISGIEAGRQGTRLKQKEVGEALAILSLAEEHGLYHLISELNMQGGKDISMYSIDGAEFRFGRGEYVRKMVMLETFWKEFAKSEDPKRLASVDLRYDGQVVVKWNTPGGLRPGQVSM